MTDRTTDRNSILQRTALLIEHLLESRVMTEAERTEAFFLADSLRDMQSSGEPAAERESRFKPWDEAVAHFTRGSVPVRVLSVRKVPMQYLYNLQRIDNDWEYEGVTESWLSSPETKPAGPFKVGDLVAHVELDWTGAVEGVSSGGMLNVVWDHTKEVGLISSLRVVPRAAPTKGEKA